MVRERETHSETAPWSVNDLIERAERIISAAPDVFGKDERETKRELLNVRLIRDYVVREFIPRPVRVGKEARFGLNHLVYLLAVRALLRNRKWSLPAIKASFANTSTDDLLSGILSQVRSRVEAEYRRATKTAENRAGRVQERVQTPPLNPAQLLIQNFKAEAQPQTGKSAPPLHRLRDMTSVDFSAASLQPQRKTDNRSKLHVPLESWCEVVIDAERLSVLTPEEIERLGEALKRRLQDETEQ